MASENKVTLKEKLKHMGPGAMVASAIIGPGTVTTCGIAGYTYGLNLCWTAIVAVLMVVISQILTTRIALGSGMGLANSIRAKYEHNKIIWYIIAILLFIAIPITNCGYQAGNVSGAAVGSTIIVGDHVTASILVIGVVALILLISGKFSLIRNILTGLILLMVILFLISAIMARPNLTSLLKGMFLPNIPEGATLTAAGLVGTTIALTNVMLHCASTLENNKAAKTDEQKDRAKSFAYFDIGVAGVMTCVVTVCIMIVGNAIAESGSTVASAADIAIGLEPIAGTFAKYVFALGIFSAGISSSLTLPMGAGYTLSGILNFEPDANNKKFKICVIIIHIIGCTFAIMGGSPTELILFVQPLGALTLPVGMILIWRVVIDKKIMGRYTASKALRVCCLLMICFSLFMSAKTFYTYLFA